MKTIRYFMSIILGFCIMVGLSFVVVTAIVSAMEEMTSTEEVSEPVELTEMQKLYEEIAIIVEDMDIREGLEGIRTLEELIEKQTGEEVYVQYKRGESETEEGERYIIETLGKSYKSSEGRFRNTSISITDKETGEEIYIIWENERHLEEGGTVLNPYQDYSMNIIYLNSNYRVESFRYDYEEVTTYMTTYELYDEKGSYIKTIEEKYDNVFEVFNALY